MKSFNKYICLFLSVMLIAGGSGCAKEESQPREYTQIYEAGLDITYLLSEMASSDEYITFFTGDTAVKDVVKKIGDGDYSKPKAVYEIMITDEMFERLVDTASLDNATDELKKSLTDRVRSSFITQLNGTAGVNSLAASGICTAGKTFINPIADGIILVYTYENGYPIAITFTAEPDGLAGASGTFVMVEDFDSIEGIKSYFSETDIEVLEVTQ